MANGNMTQFKVKNENCLRPECHNTTNLFSDVCDDCAKEAKIKGCSWEDLSEININLEKTELRRGYASLREWLDNGRKPKFDIAFTDGDIRFCANIIDQEIHSYKDSLIKELERMHCKCEFSLDNQCLKYQIIQKIKNG
jgi:hypothetical protein